MRFLDILFALALSLCAASVQAAQPADLFDFWLGDWQLSWTNADGSTGRARNRVSKVLDGVIEEQFEQDPAAAAPLLRGRSLSVLHKGSGLWKQAWADNQGGFFVFTAELDGQRRIFATEMRADGEKLRGQRMVFHSIQTDSLVWDWEGTNDGGKTWQLLWRLNYRR